MGSCLSESSNNANALTPPQGTTLTLTSTLISPNVLNEPFYTEIIPSYLQKQFPKDMFKPNLVRLEPRFLAYKEFIYIFGWYEHYTICIAYFFLLKLLYIYVFFF